MLIATVVLLLGPILVTAFMLVCFVIVILMWLFGIIVYLCIAVVFLAIVIIIPFFWIFGILV